MAGRAGVLEWVERVGNRLPDPVALFLLALAIVMGASALLAPVAFAETDPRTVGPGKQGEPIRVRSLLTVAAGVEFGRGMVDNFVRFPPLGFVLVALIGVAVAEKTGLLPTALRAMLAATPRRLLTPMVLVVSILSHSAADVGFVVVIPVAAGLFRASGRHPLAGIACAFAGVSGGFSANFLPSALDPVLSGFTQAAARLIDPEAIVNPLCNWWFQIASSVLLTGVAWAVTELVVEPRLGPPPTPPASEAGGDAADAGPAVEPLTGREWLGLAAAAAALAALAGAVACAAWPGNSPLRHDGALLGAKSPLLDLVVPLLFLACVLPGLAFGFAAGTWKGHRQLIGEVAGTLGTLNYYIVMAFVAAQFTAAFRDSNLGALLSLKGAKLLTELNLPGPLVLVGIVLLTTLVDLVIGSASAKWAVMAPVLVPMLMQVGFTPEWTQAAFRVGASCANVITPLMPYFPLVVSYCRRHDGTAGIGSLAAMMLPYFASFLASWTALLLLWRAAGWPLGL